MDDNVELAKRESKRFRKIFLFFRLLYRDRIAIGHNPMDATVPSQAKCGAMNREGQPCGNAPSKHHGQRCKFHGGAVGSGRPKTHGRRSRDYIEASRKLNAELNALLAEGRALGLYK
jgi:hypothetical protein